MSIKGEMITSVSKEIEREFGKPGTAEREKFDEEAYAFYRQVLKIAFAVFLAFSWAGFAYFLKEHGELCDWKRKQKMLR